MPKTGRGALGSAVAVAVAVLEREMSSHWVATISCSIQTLCWVQSASRERGMNFSTLSWAVEHRHVRQKSFEGKECIKPQTGSDLSTSVMTSKPFGAFDCEIISYLKQAVGTF